MTQQHPTQRPAGPVVIVGFVALTIPFIEAFQPEGSVIYVEEPDVARKRDAPAKLASVGYVRGLIEWEYHLPGKADEFYAAHPDLAPVAVVPAVEYAVPFAARLAERYGLPGASLGAALVLRDKALLRQVSAAAGIANPASVRVDSAAAVEAFLAEHPGPAVLKPANRQASLGVRVVGGPEEVAAAWAECLVQDEGVFVPDRPMDVAMLAEQFVQGDEYSVEMLVRGGEPLFTNVTGKKLYPGPYPVELAHIVPADIPDELTRLLGAQTARLMAAVGFGDGVVHCEWIVSGGVPYLVECAGRMPGDAILDLIEAAYPLEFMRAYFAVLKGEPLPAELPVRAKSGAAVRFLAPGAGTVAAVHGVEDAERADGVLFANCAVAPGTSFAGLRNSWDRTGIVMTRADSPAQAHRLAGEAAALVRFEMVPQEADAEAAAAAEKP
ncbi:ATP-grasp domain-containing protein [Actinacidiphila bryophytorum]|uniref:ATP-grasp domain-containing protein n=1 Tax=Actinacidiphila bryophytorum TaxID=1436133 RepID=UPI0021769986|nr:ATP-grasp domain-containing protein [Actinacidiphila bryophytorum]UWE12995.1 ATP-grasp domain-containing protein [Actinacidiphila bryophytorum]